MVAPVASQSTPFVASIVAVVSSKSSFVCVSAVFSSLIVKKSVARAATSFVREWERSGADRAQTKAAPRTHEKTSAISSKRHHLKFV